MYPKTVIFDHSDHFLDHSDHFWGPQTPQKWSHWLRTHGPWPMAHGPWPMAQQPTGLYSTVQGQPIGLYSTVQAQPIQYSTGPAHRPTVQGPSPSGSSIVLALTDIQQFRRTVLPRSQVTAWLGSLVLHKSTEIQALRYTDHYELVHDIRQTEQT